MVLDFGIALTSLGAVVSFGPPVMALGLAQFHNKKTQKSFPKPSNMRIISD
jgi:hypothetical protein